MIGLFETAGRTVMIEHHTQEGILRTVLERLFFSESIYRRLADSVEDAATSAVFLAIAQAEQRQRKKIELELFKLGSVVSESELSEQAEKEKWPDWKFLAKRMRLRDAFELAIERQKESFRLYAEWMAGTSNPHAADLLFELCREEMRQLLQLEKECQSIFPGWSG